MGSERTATTRLRFDASEVIAKAPKAAQAIKSSMADAAQTAERNLQRVEAALSKQQAKVDQAARAVSRPGARPEIASIYAKESEKLRGLQVKRNWSEYDVTQAHQVRMRRVAERDRDERIRNADTSKEERKQRIEQRKERVRERAEELRERRDGQSQIRRELNIAWSQGVHDEQQRIMDEAKATEKARIEANKRHNKIALAQIRENQREEQKATAASGVGDPMKDKSIWGPAGGRYVLRQNFRYAAQNALMLEGGATGLIGSTLLAGSVTAAAIAAPILAVGAAFHYARKYQYELIDSQQQYGRVLRTEANFMKELTLAPSTQSGRAYHASAIGMREEAIQDSEAGKRRIRDMGLLDVAYIAVESALKGGRENTAFGQSVRQDVATARRKLDAANRREKYADEEDKAEYGYRMTGLVLQREAVQTATIINKHDRERAELKVKQKAADAEFLATEQEGQRNMQRRVDEEWSRRGGSLSPETTAAMNAWNTGNRARNVEHAAMLTAQTAALNFTIARESRMESHGLAVRAAAAGAMTFDERQAALAKKHQAEFAAYTGDDPLGLLYAQGMEYTKAPRERMRAQANTKTELQGQLDAQKGLVAGAAEEWRKREAMLRAAHVLTPEIAAQKREYMAAAAARNEADRLYLQDNPTEKQFVETRRLKQEEYERGQLAQALVARQEQITEQLRQQHIQSRVSAGNAQQIMAEMRAGRPHDWRESVTREIHAQAVANGWSREQEQKALAAAIAAREPEMQLAAQVDAASMTYMGRYKEFARRMDFDVANKGMTGKQATQYKIDFLRGIVDRGAGQFMDSASRWQSIQSSLLQNDPLAREMGALRQALAGLLKDQLDALKAGIQVKGNN